MSAIRLLHRGEDGKQQGCYGHLSNAYPSGFFELYIQFRVSAQAWVSVQIRASSSCPVASPFAIGSSSPPLQVVVHGDAHPKAKVLYAASALGLVFPFLGFTGVNWNVI